MRNPFRYDGVVTGPFFADRTKEIAELTREIENLNRVFLVSPRRLGKTCLLHNLMANLDPNQNPSVYFDLNAFPDLGSFAASLANLTTKALETNTEKLVKVFSTFKRLRLKMDLGPDGDISAGLGLAAESKDALEALLEGLAHANELAGRKKKTLSIIIDEFSDIEKYNGGTIEKVIRSEIQKHEHISYIFSGSEQSVMLAMVRDKNRAFYKMGRIMSLGPIEQKAYEKFIRGWFDKGGYTVSKEDVRRILHIGGNVTYNVQRLCHVAWEATIEEKKIDSDTVRELPFLIVRQDAPHYEILWQTISRIQKLLLIALIQDPDAKPFSKDFQFRHKVGPSSSIKASLDSLFKKGVLYKTTQGHYQFVDLFMPYWVEDIRKRR